MQFLKDCNKGLQLWFEYNRIKQKTKKLEIRRCNKTKFMFQNSQIYLEASYVKSCVEFWNLFENVLTYFNPKKAFGIGDSK